MMDPIRKDPPAHIRGTGYGPPTSERIAEAVGTGPGTWNNTLGTTGGGGGSLGTSMHQGLVHGMSKRDFHSPRRPQTERPTWQHTTKLACLMAAPPEKFEPALSHDHVSYASQLSRPATSGVPRHPFALHKGLPEQSTLANDERAFNQFWYGKKFGEPVDKMMHGRWINFTLAFENPVNPVGGYPPRILRQSTTF